MIGFLVDVLMVVYLDGMESNVISNVWLIVIKVFVIVFWVIVIFVKMGIME